MKLETRNLQAEAADRRGIPMTVYLRDSAPPATADCRLPTANCLLPTANCLLPTANCQLPTANCQLPTANGAGARRRAGFTLVEMLTVITIISILIGVTGISLIKARELARRTRADTELREMVSAWLQYQQLYEEWPTVVKGKIEIPVTGAVLDPLINPESDDNPRSIVFLNVKLASDTATFNDPWGTPYELSFDRDTANIPTITALRTSITFPNRQRRFP